MLKDNQALKEDSSQAHREVDQLKEECGTHSVKIRELHGQLALAESKGEAD